MSRRLPVILLAAGLSACVSGGGNDWRIHYVSFDATPPQGNRVTVCHAYTCKEQTTYTFTPDQMAEIAALMNKTKRADTPFEERRSLAVRPGREPGRGQGRGLVHQRPELSTKASS